VIIIKHISEKKSTSICHKKFTSRYRCFTWRAH